MVESIMIISGHGTYATALKSTIELIAGSNTDMYFVDFLVTDTDTTLRAKIHTVLHKNMEKQVLFVCDILGGTPFKIAAEIANNNDNMEVVAGVNVGSIIEMMFQKDELSISDLSDLIIETSKKSTIKFTKVKIAAVKAYREKEDGI
jgi:PTS system N-acetylgalactosamine-specific IIA component